jgi:hypothetical protein
VGVLGAIWLSDPPGVMWTGALKISQQVLENYYVTQPYLEKGFVLVTKSIEQQPVSDIIAQKIRNQKKNLRRFPLLQSFSM